MSKGFKFFLIYILPWIIYLIGIINFLPILSEKYSCGFAILGCFPPLGFILGIMWIFIYPIVGFILSIVLSKILNNTYLLEKKGDLIKQISKFIIVGVINTGIDFAVLNALMFSIKIYSGKWLILFNSISFSAAVINSYFLNKYWTFKTQNAVESKTKQFSQFLLVSIVGISINDAIVYGLATFTSPLFGLSAHLWTNVAKIFATLASMVWNFIGYKFIVFSAKGGSASGGKSTVDF